ncbi:PP2C family protein-serine/threonine phosphatase [Sulfitobacter sp. JB4-11]|uniref:PP2C family protein-serine/threonine phosphatase n=1 Tax=Sulfitobacter rhodophyticola TaxID=3238304 RepID=UPI003511FA8F
MRRFPFSAASHIGNFRKINEDRVLTLPEHRIWVVADGMGGHAAGDFASQTVVDHVAAMPKSADPHEQSRALRRTILETHAIIMAESEARGDGPIGAAVAALVVTDDRFICLWAGDCRLYRLRDRDLQMLTVDHSIVADLVGLGELTWDEAEHHPQANMITRAVGMGDALELDAVQGSVMRGDRFLLCTDGLSNFADLETQRLTLMQAPIDEVADRLTRIALDCGAADNISVIAIEVS